MKLSHCFAAAVAAAGLLTAAQAEAVSFTAGNYLQSRIGAEIETDFDTLQISGLSSFVDAASPAWTRIAELSFTVGPNCTSCALTPSFDALVDFTVNGATQQIDLPYSWWSSGPTDHLAFGTPASLRFDLDSGATLQVAFEAPGAMSSAGGTVYGDLRASFSVQPAPATAVSVVPEPQTFALLLAGLGAIGFVARRRR